MGSKSNVPPWMQGWSSPEEQADRDFAETRRNPDYWSSHRRDDVLDQLKANADACVPDGQDVKIWRTKYRLAKRDTVEVERKTENREGLTAKSWVEVINNGQEREKPHPDIFGDDHWPDWQDVVKQAKERLAGGDVQPDKKQVDGRRFHAL